MNIPVSPFREWGYDEDGDTIQINNMTIDEKVAFWQKVMKYGREQGFWYLFLYLEYILINR